MINGDAFKLAFGERKFLTFHPYPEILTINHFYTMTLHKKGLSALKNHHTSSFPMCIISKRVLIALTHKVKRPILITRSRHITWLHGFPLKCDKFGKCVRL